LQLFVKSQDLQVQLHRIFLDDSGGRRQGLTEQEKLQVREASPKLTLLPALCFLETLC
jgi:hypothetical protein